MDTAYVRGKPPPKQPYFRFSFYHFRYLKFLAMKPEVLVFVHQQWLFLVPLIGGRWYIITQLAVYTTYIPLLYCQLGDFIFPTTPTTYSGNQETPLTSTVSFQSHDQMTPRAKPTTVGRFLPAHQPVAKTVTRGCSAGECFLHGAIPVDSKRAGWSSGEALPYISL